MHQTSADECAGLPLLEALAPDYRKRLLQRATNLTAPRGTLLFNEGQVPEALHVLLSGRVELYARTEADHETIVEVLEPGECFILAAVLTGAPYLMSARTGVDSELLVLPAAALVEDLVDQPDLGLALMGTLARQYRGMVREIKNLKLRTAAERVGCYLYTLAREQGTRGRVHLPYPKRSLAARMGMAPEHLSRAFARLRERGVRLEGSTVIIDDLNRLAEYCRPDTLIDGVEHDLSIAVPDRPPSGNRPALNRRRSGG